MLFLYTKKQKRLEDISKGWCKKENYVFPFNLNMVIIPIYRCCQIIWIISHNKKWINTHKQKIGRETTSFFFVVWNLASVPLRKSPYDTPYIEKKTVIINLLQAYKDAISLVKKKKWYCILVNLQVIFLHSKQNKGYYTLMGSQVIFLYSYRWRKQMGLHLWGPTSDFFCSHRWKKHIG